MSPRRAGAAQERCLTPVARSRTVHYGAVIHRRAPTPRVGGAAGDRGASPARRHGETSPAAPGPLRVARRASHDPPSAILVPFRRARLVGGACPIGERGQDAADGCPDVSERRQACIRRCLPSSAAGAPAQAPRRLASWGRAAPPRLSSATRRPWCARSFVGATQTNGDRATRSPARIHTPHALGERIHA